MKKLFASLIFAAVSAHAGVIGAPGVIGMQGPEINTNFIHAALPGSTDARIQDQQGSPAHYGGIGDFRTLCGYSHMDFADPLVFPGQPDRSHLHTFFGNTTTNAYSTDDSLKLGPSTCSGGILNRSSYWVPSLIDVRSGTPLTPKTLLVYYKGDIWDFAVTPTSITPVPQGLRMIAGNAANDHDLTVDSKGNPTWIDSHYKYACMDLNHNQVGPWYQTLPSCPAGELWQFVSFPRCWDGVNLDSADHKSHVRYPMGGACPTGFTSILPHITYVVEYSLAENNMLLRLSSDMYSNSIPGGYSSHGDYWMKWDQDIMNQIINGCLNAGNDCHVDYLGNGKMLY